MISNIWKLHSVRFDHATVPVIVGSMQSVGMPTDAEVVREVNAGRIYPTQAHVNFRSAAINFTSWNLQDLLDVCGLAGLCISVTATYTDFDVFVARYDCNQIVSGSVHTQYRVNRGIVYPTGITIDHQGNAQINYSCMAIFDGSNSPILKVTGVALPTVPAGEDDRWTMYDATVRGVAVTQKKSINIDFGAQVNTEGADSEQYDSWASLDNVSPVITFQGIDPDWWLAAGPVINLAGDDVVFGQNRLRLKKRSALIGTANHILIDTQGIARISDPFSSTGNEPGRTELRIESIQDNLGNVPLTIQTNQIIV